MTTPTVDITSELDRLDDGSFERSRYWNVPDPSEFILGIVRVPPATHADDTPPRQSSVTVEELPDEPTRQNESADQNESVVDSAVDAIKNIRVDDDNIAYGDIEFERFKKVASLPAASHVYYENEDDYVYEPSNSSKRDDTSDMIDALISEVHSLHSMVSRVLRNQEQIQDDQRVILDRLYELRQMAYR